MQPGVKSEMLFKVTPRSFSNYVRNACLRNAIVCANNALRFAVSATATNLSNLIADQLRHSVNLAACAAYATMPDFVGDILFCSSPPEILDTIVIEIPIPMCALILRAGLRADKRLKH